MEDMERWTFGHLDVSSWNARRDGNLGLTSTMNGKSRIFLLPYIITYQAKR